MLLDLNDGPVKCNINSGLSTEGGLYPGRFPVYKRRVALTRIIIIRSAAFLIYRTV